MIQVGDVVTRLKGKRKMTVIKITGDMIECAFATKYKGWTSNIIERVFKKDKIKKYGTV